MDTDDTGDTDDTVDTDDTGDTDDTSVPDETPLRFVLEFHLENTRDPLADQTDMVRAVSESAHRNGVPVSFAVTTRFLNDFISEETIAQFVADGHATTLHTGVDDESADEIVANIESLQTALSEHPGTSPEVVSGGCNAEPSVGGRGWLEALDEAGITTLAGVVEHCQLSLDPEGANADAYDDAINDDCVSGGPVGCHAPAPSTEPLAFRLQTWNPATTDEWLEDAGGSVAVMSSIPDFSADCAAEGVENCQYETAEDAEADVAAIFASIDDALLADPHGIYHMTWSTHRIASQAYIEAWFVAFEEALIEYDGAVEPRTLTDYE